MQAFEDLDKGIKSAAQILREAGVRPTAQRLALAAFLFDGCDKHQTAEQVFEALGAKRGKKGRSATRVSLATVYNTLNLFKTAGLLREISVDAQRRFYDTNTGDHGHVFDPQTGGLMDLPPETLALPPLPDRLQGRKIARMEVTLWLAPDEVCEEKFSSATESSVTTRGL